MCGYTVVYDTKKLWDYKPTTRDQYSRLSPELFHHIKTLGILRRAHQGRCAADYRPRHIPVVSSRGGIVSYSPAGQLNASLLPTVALSTGSKPRCATLGLANAHSVRNKTDLLIYHVLEHNLDLVALSETWLSADNNDKKTISDLTPAGYDFAHISRPERKCNQASKQKARKERGGGVGLLFRSSFKVTILPKRAFKTFEHMDVIARSSGGSLRLAIVYRPPPSKKNRLSTADLLEELPDFFEEYSLVPGRVIFLGDFNIHWNMPSNPARTKFANILDTFNLVQHVLESTHVDGNILDLVISRSCEVSILPSKVSTLASDHHWVHSQVSLEKSQVPRRDFTFRRFKSVDLSAFRLDISTSEIILQPANTVDQLYSQYSTVMSGLVDGHAPLCTCSMPVRSLVPWYRQDILEAKWMRQCRECTWQWSGLVVHYQIYRAQCTAVHNLIRSAKSDFYTILSFGNVKAISEPPIASWTDF